MESLVHSMLSNAATAAVLALAIGAFSRSCRRPALVHCLWLVVLLKLITPPLVPVSLPRSLPACISGLAPGRGASASRFVQPVGVAPDQRVGDRLDDLQGRLESSEAPPDDHLASNPHPPGNVLTDRSLEESRFPQPTGHRELPSQRASRHAARRSVVPTWAIRLIAMSARQPWEPWALLIVLAGAGAWWSLATVRIVRFHCTLKPNIWD